MPVSGRSPANMMDSYTDMRRIQLAAARKFTPEQAALLSFCEPYAAVRVRDEAGLDHTFLFMERIDGPVLDSRTTIDQKLATAFGYPIYLRVIDTIRLVIADQLNIEIIDIHPQNVLTVKDGAATRYTVIDPRSDKN